MVTSLKNVHHDMLHMIQSILKLQQKKINLVLLKQKTWYSWLWYFHRSSRFFVSAPIHCNYNGVQHLFEKKKLCVLWGLQHVAVRVLQKKTFYFTYSCKCIRKTCKSTRKFLITFFTSFVNQSSFVTRFFYKTSLWNHRWRFILHSRWKH